MNQKRIGVFDRRSNVFRAVLAAALALALLSGTLSVPAEGSEKTYIVKYKSSACPEAGDAPFAVVSRREMLRLDRAGLLAWYEPDGEVELLGTASPYFTEAQWNLDMVCADAAFRKGFLGQGVRVGVLDSGVNPHPFFADRLLPGRNYIPGAEDPEDTADSYGHGTCVAGLIAAAAGADGFIGTAPGAEIVPLKVTDG